MKKRLSKIWNDPVGSKVIANLIWLILLALGTFIYVFYQQMDLSISFRESLNRLFLKLGEERTVTNWHYLIAFLIALVLLVNRKLILTIIGFVLKAALGIRQYEFKYEYNLTNQGRRSAGIISNERSFNIFKIKPQNETKDWSLKILFSHSYSDLENEDQNFETIRIFKKHEENKLKLESHAKTDKANKQTFDLIDNYLDQEIRLNFDLSHEVGGIILTISRLDQKIYTSEVKYGCSHFKIIAEDSNLDFNLKVNHVRLE